MTAEFTCTTTTTISAAELFDRSRSIDAHTASMRFSRERAVAGVTAGLIGAGEQVTWHAWHFGVPIRMTSVITDFAPPHRFVDEQLSGPFRSFRHVHEFSETDGVTTMVDRIRFTAPFGIAGVVAERVLLRPYLRYLIGVRNRSLTAGPAADGTPGQGSGQASAETRGAVSSRLRWSTGRSARYWGNSRRNSRTRGQ
ncbi:SRPBCC family protein [Arthrobacter sp. Ld5]|uniref:SRPBCC family protein n=1 Tax=Arthrobacter sp. Ld5 TaxID=649152 RepID=UPI003EBEE180